MKTRLMILFIIFTFSFLLWLSIYNLSHKSYMQVKFLDVGQGDSTLITTPHGGHILVDGGKDNLVLERLGRELNFFDRKINLVIATHDDLDHIGGLVEIINRYEVDSLMTSSLDKKNSTLKNLLSAAEEKEVKIILSDSQKIIETDDGVKIEILFPTQNMSGVEDGNSASVVAKITYGKVSFLLTGDLPHAGELYLVDIYSDKLKSDVLKLGHHGSDTSTHPKFLQTVAPIAVVASAGLDNKFGHPHKSVLELAEKFGAKTYSTLGKGNVEFATDGITIWEE